MMEDKQYKEIIKTTRTKEVIGLVGPKRVGKSTYADKLQETTKGVIMSFADPIRRLTDSYTSFHPEKSKEDFRPVLQGIGDVCRGYDRDFFVDCMVSNIIDITTVFNNIVGCGQAVELDPETVIIDDVRYMNEALICDKVIILSREGVDYTEEHSSENGFDSNDIQTLLDSGVQVVFETLE